MGKIAEIIALSKAIKGNNQSNSGNFIVTLETLYDSSGGYTLIADKTTSEIYEAILRHETVLLYYYESYLINDEKIAILVKVFNNYNIYYHSNNDDDYILFYSMTELYDHVVRPLGFKFYRSNKIELVNESKLYYSNITTGAQTGMIMRSCTAGSTKYFRIEVLDDGSIKTSEVKNLK